MRTPPLYHHIYINIAKKFGVFATTVVAVAAAAVSSNCAFCVLTTRDSINN